MTRTLDELLKAVAPITPDRSLDQLEPAVWSRIEADRTQRSGADRGFRMQLVAAGMALVVGLALGWSMSSARDPDDVRSLYASYADLGPIGRLENGL